MSKKTSNDIVIRDKRQVTLPRDICEQLGVEEGDKLTVYVEGNRLVAKPTKNVAMDSLREIQRLFKESDVTEKELLKTSRRIRKELVIKHYGRQD
jgi:AbrB family looped-hinge helix DNA binding protein